MKEAVVKECKRDYYALDLHKLFGKVIVIECEFCMISFIFED